MSALEDALAAAVLAPDDDAPRLVLQDALLEARDPRGEFVALQFKQLRLEDTAEDRARMGKLLATHGRAWLGALEPWVELASVRFDRGYLERALLKREAFAADARTAWLGERTLPLLRELLIPGGVTPGELEATLRDPALARLRVATFEEKSLVSRLARAAQPWSFRGIGLRGTVKQVMDALEPAMRGPAMAGVSELVIDAQRFSRSAALELSKRLVNPAITDLLLEKPLFAVAPRVLALTLRADVDGEVLGYAASVLAAALPRASLRLESLSVRLEVRRTPDPARFDVALACTNGPEPLFKAIGAMSGAIGTLRVQQQARTEPGDAQLDALRGHLRRLKPGRVSLPVVWGLPDEGL